MVESLFSVLEIVDLGFIIVNKLKKNKMFKNKCICREKYVDWKLCYYYVKLGGLVGNRRVFMFIV